MRIPFAMFLLTGVVSATSVAQAQDVSYSRAESPRTFFPKGWVRGFADVAIAPPHNEPDLNRCTAWAGIDGGASAPCSAFARYVASGYIEFQPVAAGLFHRAFLFVEPHAYFGRNVPQFQYSASPMPMAIERAVGIGVELPRNFELRLTQHRLSWMGRYGNHLGMADLGKNGPLGLYTTVSARWYFGGYRGRL
jgi:hypothetical protein